MMPHYVLAYEVAATHPAITEFAVNKSKLVTEPLLPNVGISSSQVYITLSGPNNDIKRFYFEELIKKGVIEEDNGTRPIQHFYNAVDDKGITVLGHTYTASPDYILEDKEQIAGQYYSYDDAKRYYYDAMTDIRDGSRFADYATMFQSLGHVIHHIQDMAQPEHARVDYHYTKGEKERIEDLDVGLSLQDPSLYEFLVNSLGKDLPYGEYPSVMLPTPRDYWKDNGMGLAEYTNRNFVTKDTNFDSGVNKYFPNPVFDGTKVYVENAADVMKTDIFTAESAKESLPAQCTDSDPCYMAFAPNYAAIDKYSLYGTTVDMRMTTLSMFDQFLKISNKKVYYTDPITSDTYEYTDLFSLNRFNYATRLSMLISRAAGYSSGLLNYFFRGKFQISLPDEGVYSIVDHASTNTANSSGFTKIKLKVKNITSPIKVPEASVGGITYNDVPQDMTNGEFVLVGRYKLNNCYNPDMEGEFEVGSETTSNGCNSDEYSSTENYGVKSNVVSGIDLIAGGDAKDMTFTFPTPIPINAVDLHLQLVFRGKLGEEIDSVAANDVNISEPTYFTISNSTDYMFVNGNPYTYDEITNDSDLYNAVYSSLYVGRPIYKARGFDFDKLQLWVNPGYTLATTGLITQGNFARFAFLMPNDKTVKFNISGISYNHASYENGIKDISYVISDMPYYVSPKINEDIDMRGDRHTTMRTPRVSLLTRYRGNLQWSSLTLLAVNDDLVTSVLSDIQLLNLEANLKNYPSNPITSTMSF